MGFWYCVIYIAVLGILSFIIGRLLPKGWFHADKFPYKTAAGEQKIYQALRVKSWQSKVPDMSRLFRHIMPAKKMTAETVADIPRMLEETCVAELTHTLLSILGLAMLWLWPGWGGIIVTIIYILLGNVPFIIIQRYNRPRLQRLYVMQQRKRERSSV